MEEKIIGNMGKGPQCIPIVNGKGFPGPVARGHHQDIRSLFQKQIMQGCIGQHNPQTAVIRRQVRRKPPGIVTIRTFDIFPRIFLGQQHNRPVVGV